MADYPDLLTQERHRDLVGRERHPWIRRVFLLLVGALLVAALVNTFGQRSETVHASGPAARLEVHGPKRVRGGLLYQQRITVHALQDIAPPPPGPAPRPARRPTPKTTTPRPRGGA